MQFQRTIGIDYSGAGTADDVNDGLSVFMTEQGGVAREPSGRKRWTRRELTNWLIEKLKEPTPTIAAIDHAFSFPEAYFKDYNIPRKWDEFLKDFCEHWPTDEEGINPSSLRNNRNEKASARCGKRIWLRETEEQCKKQGHIPSSVFCFVGPKQVGPSTHAGLPFLQHIRESLPSLHIWPFDGWEIPRGKSCLVEAYPAIYKEECDYPKKNSHSPHDYDAYITALWLRNTDRNGRLQTALKPNLSQEVLSLAEYEGWILGVTGIKKPITKHTSRKSARKKKKHRDTTEIGFENRNAQVVIQATGKPGNDHNQKIYELECKRCGSKYGSNGSDIFQRRCPCCDNGRPGLPL